MCILVNGKVAAFTGDIEAIERALATNGFELLKLDSIKVTPQFSGMRQPFRITEDRKDQRLHQKWHRRVTWDENGERVVRYCGNSSHGLHGRQLYKCRKLRANGSIKTRAAQAAF